TPPREFNFEEALYTIRLELRDNKLRTKSWILKNNRWDAVSSIPESDSQPGIDVSGLPAEGPFALGRWGIGDHTRIRLWDLSPAEGAFSDLSLFLAPPGSRVILWNFTGAYLTRRYTPTDKNRMSDFLKSLPTKISISYNTRVAGLNRAGDSDDEDGWIVKP